MLRLRWMRADLQHNIRHEGRLITYQCPAILIVRHGGAEESRLEHVRASHLLLQQMHDNMRCLILCGGESLKA